MTSEDNVKGEQASTPQGIENLDALWRVLRPADGHLPAAIFALGVSPYSKTPGVSGRGDVVGLLECRASVQEQPHTDLELVQYANMALLPKELRQQVRAAVNAYYADLKAKDPAAHEAALVKFRALAALSPPAKA